MKHRSILAIVTLALVSAPVFAAASPASPPATPPATPPGMSEVRSASLKWEPLDLPGFVPGMKAAVLSGDPYKEGPYTLRLLFPAGYNFPAHWHPSVENLTVMSGTLKFAMGDKTVASKLQKYKPGDFFYIPAEHPHFGGAEGETVIQLHGPGPFGVTVLEKIEGALPNPSSKPQG